MLGDLVIPGTQSLMNCVYNLVPNRQLYGTSYNYGHGDAIPYNFCH